MTADKRNSVILDDTYTKDDRESTLSDIGMMHGAAGTRKQGKGAHIHSADAVKTGTADECCPEQIRMAGGSRRTSWSTPLHSARQAGLTWMRDWWMLTVADNELGSRIGRNTNRQQLCQRTNTLDNAVGQYGGTCCAGGVGG
eukprot:3509399-Rhodomonas_salina.1